jgi:CBS domain containing-hemolysin-like protein
MTAGLMFASESPPFGIGWSLVAAAVLILANGLFVAFEFALIASKRSVFESAAEEGGRIAKSALDAISDLSVQLAGAQLGITMATLALGYVGEPTLAYLLEGVLDRALSEDAIRVVGFIIALAIVTFLHLVVGEMVPKNIAIASPEATVRWLVLPYRAYLLVARPLVVTLNYLANVGCRLVGVEPRDELHASHSVAELAAIVSLSSREGGIEADSAEVLQGALDFAERPVGEIVRPLSEIATLRMGATAAQAEAVVVSTGQTRIPIVSPALGEARIVGYLHAKDLLKIPASGRGAPIPDSLQRRMVVVRSDRSLVQTLRTLRQLRRQMAVVVSADGPVGVVSVEEVIEALVAPLQQVEFAHQP